MDVSEVARVRRAQAADFAEWSRMRRLLWPEVTDAENEVETAALLADDGWAVFVADAGDGLVGFVEARLREYAEGCDSSPVGFVEGWYVDPEARRSGVGRWLVEAAEGWARESGCTEMASDSLIDNDEGHRAHEAIGFAEVERLVCFRKSLG